MEKQNKVLKLINRECGKTTPLGTVPNDECYTSMQDIINELSHWADKFHGKNIICPCDWDIVDDDHSIYSLKIVFDGDGVHGHTNTIKSLFYTEFENGDKPKSIKLEKDKIDEFLRSRLSCNFVRTFVEYAEQWGIKSITASGFNPAAGKGIRFQEVDFSEYDICVTNPPFSMYGEFLEKLLDSGISFVVLAPFLNRANPSVGLPLMLKKCFLGYGRKIRMNFHNPTAENDYKTKLVAVDWLTSFNDAQKKVDESRLQNGFMHSAYSDDFVVMENMTMKDGTHPIRVESFRGIPDDYRDWVFCAIGVLDVLSNEEFEWYGTSFRKYFNQTSPTVNPFAHKIFDEMVAASTFVEGFGNMTQQEKRNKCKELNEKGFHGIVLRRRK